MLPDLYVEGLHDNILLVLPFVISVRPKEEKKYPTEVSYYCNNILLYHSSSLIKVIKRKSSTKNARRCRGQLYSHRKYEQNSVFLFVFRKWKGFFCTIPRLVPGCEHTRESPRLQTSSRICTARRWFFMENRRVYDYHRHVIESLFAKKTSLQIIPGKYECTSREKITFMLYVRKIGRTKLAFLNVTRKQKKRTHRIKMTFCKVYLKNCYREKTYSSNGTIVASKFFP